MLSIVRGNVCATAWHHLCPRAQRRMMQAMSSRLSRSGSGTTSPTASPEPSLTRGRSANTMQKLERMRLSFNDRAASSVAIALEVPGSGVTPRRKPRPLRAGRKAGVWNSVADLLSTLTHHKSSEDGSVKSPKREKASPESRSPRFGRWDIADRLRADSPSSQRISATPSLRSTSASELRRTSNADDPVSLSPASKRRMNLTKRWSASR